MGFIELINRVAYLSFVEQQAVKELEDIRKRLRGAVTGVNGVVTKHVPDFRALTVEQWSAIVLTRDITDPNKVG